MYLSLRRTGRHSWLTCSTSLETGQFARMGKRMVRTVVHSADWTTGQLTLHALLSGKSDWKPEGNSYNRLEPGSRKSESYTRSFICGITRYVAGSTDVKGSQLTCPIDLSLGVSTESRSEKANASKSLGNRYLEQHSSKGALIHNQPSLKAVLIMFPVTLDCQAYQSHERSNTTTSAFQSAAMSYLPDFSRRLIT